jgi:hypothetical protein
MRIGREGAICEVTIVMQISPVRAMKVALIAASRGFCKIRLLELVMAGLVPAIHVFLALSFVMPGPVPGIHVFLAALSFVVPGLVPGIHVFATARGSRRGWPGQARP